MATVRAIPPTFSLTCLVSIGPNGFGPEKRKVLFIHGCKGPKLFPITQLDDDPHHPSLISLFSYHMKIDVSSQLD